MKEVRKRLKKDEKSFGYQPGGRAAANGCAPFALRRSAYGCLATLFSEIFMADS
jgi:hypothetical protein